MTDQQLYARLSAFITDNKRDLFDRLAPLRTRHITAVLEDIYQPHNASAVLRSCDLLGVQDVHIIEGSHTFTPSADVALGSSKWLDLHRYKGEGGTAACIRQLRSAGHRIVVTSPRPGGCTPADVPIDAPLCVCFGTELTGATDQLLDAADLHLRIPMFGFTESFNISVSVAITLSRITERLHETDGWQLDEAAQLALKLAWARRSVRNAVAIEERLKKGHAAGG